MVERFKSPGFVRALSWVAGLILLAGVAAVLTVWISSGAPESSAVVNNGETIPDELPVTTAPNVADVPSAARTVAVDFLVGAVARHDLAKAWTLIHPSMKTDCACTRKEWLTGNIPVQYYPADNLEVATFKVDESYVDEAVIEVALLPKKGETIKPQIFYVGLKKVGKGASASWKVNYFAPRSPPAIPNARD